MRIQRSIVETLAYHDIFDYPLTVKEITKFLTQKASLKQVETALKTRTFKIEAKKQYFYLKKRTKIVGIRLSRERFSIQKVKRANFYKNLLKHIPSVKLVAITGALAVGNSTKHDDIDLLIVTAKQTLWTTRFFANLLLWPWKRSPKSANQSGKACLNIFLEERNLKIEDKNLYTAHEIAQLKVIYSKDNTYEKFTTANKWVLKYLPNWQSEESFRREKSKQAESKKTHSTKINNIINKFAEQTLKQIQLNYMKSKQTTERIGDTQLFFHPKDTQKYVLDLYQKKLRSIKY